MSFRMKAGRPADLARVAINLAAYQNEYACRNGEDRQDHAEATNAQKLYYAPGDEKNG
jgi:hypothetical protein